MNAHDYFSAVEAMGKEAYERYAPFRVKVPTGKSGPWTVRRFTPKLDLGYMRHMRDGRAPGLGVFTALNHKNRGMVMSDTCPEVDDFMKFGQTFQGHVLVTGLGIGMAVHIMTKYRPVAKNVKSITVIEIDPHIVKLTGKFYEKSDRRVTIIRADAWEWEPEPNGRGSPRKLFDCAWHDIWDMGGQSADWRRIKARYRRWVCGGQYCWGRDV
jgi:hypothetical protein